jgi:hypothetical protein
MKTKSPPIDDSPFGPDGLLRDGCWHRWAALAARSLVLWPILDQPILVQNTGATK